MKPIGAIVPPAATVADFRERLERMKAATRGTVATDSPVHGLCPTCDQKPCRDPGGCKFSSAGIHGERQAARLDRVHEQIAHEAELLREWADAYIAGADLGRQSWLLHGEPGVGKTWLLAGAVNRVILAGRSAQFVEVRELLRDIRDSYSDGSTESESKLIRRCYVAGVLALNDPPRENVSAHTRSVLEAIVDERTNLRRPTLIAANLKAEDWRELYGAPLWSRLGERYFFSLPVNGVDLRRSAL